MMTVGGWSGSQYFRCVFPQFRSLSFSSHPFLTSYNLSCSAIMKDEAKRATFVDNMVKAAKDNGFDGIDIDYEYPGKPLSLVFFLTGRAAGLTLLPLRFSLRLASLLLFLAGSLRHTGKAGDTNNVRSVPPSV